MASSADLRIAPFAGPREELRSILELAEDSPGELEAYLHAGRAYVATIGGKNVGALLMTDADDGAAIELKNVAVTEPFQSRGIGRALVETAVRLARADGRETIVVGTAAADTGNLRFYQRLGFRLLSVERDAFTPARGYPPETTIDGVELRDRVWLDLTVSPT